MKEIVQEGFRIGYWKPGCSGQFVALSNFRIQLLSHVKAPKELPRYSGFVVEVSQKGGDGRVFKGEAFIPWYKVPNSDQLLHYIGPALPSRPLSCRLTTSQAKEFLMQICQDFLDEDEENIEEESGPRHCDAVTCTGHQPGSNVYVFGPDVQLDNNGLVIPQQRRKFMWINDILAKLQCPVNPLPCLPPVTNPLKKLIRGLQSLSGDNAISGMFLLGSAMMSMQYEPMVSRYGSLPIAVASSSISRGKSNCGKVAIAACGNYPKGYTCYLTDSMARGHLSGGVPFLYDDPSMDSVLKPLLMHSFGGGEMGTRKIQFSARCTPIVTCNEFVIEKLATADERYLSRSLIIPFNYDAPPVKVGMLNKILKKAPACLPDAIRIGNFMTVIEKELVYEVRQRVREVVAGIDGRLAMQYALAVVCVQEIAKTSGIMSTEDIWLYFEAVLVPAIEQWQASCHDADTSTIGNLLDAALSKSKHSNEQMSKFLNCVAPAIRYHRGAGPFTDGVAIRLKIFFELLNELAIAHGSLSMIRKQIKKDTKNASGMKQHFLKAGIISVRKTVMRGKDSQSKKRDRLSCKKRHAEEQQENSPPQAQGMEEHGMMEENEPNDQEHTEDLIQDEEREAERPWFFDDEDISDNEFYTLLGEYYLREVGDVQADETARCGKEIQVEQQESSPPQAQGMEEHGMMEENEPNDQEHTEDLIQDEEREAERPWFFDNEDISDNEFYTLLGEYYLREVGNVQADETARCGKEIVNSGDEGKSKKKRKCKIGKVKSLCIQQQEDIAAQDKEQKGSVDEASTRTVSVVSSPLFSARFKTTVSLSVSPQKHCRPRPIPPKCRRRLFRAQSASPIKRLSSPMKRLQVKRRDSQVFLKDLAQKKPRITTAAGDCEDNKCHHPRARSWLQCLKCERWWHCLCVGLTLKAAKNKDFVCKSCKT